MRWNSRGSLATLSCITGGGTIEKPSRKEEEKGGAQSTAPQTAEGKWDVGGRQALTISVALVDRGPTSPPVIRFLLNDDDDLLDPLRRRREKKKKQ